MDARNRSKRSLLLTVLLTALVAMVGCGGGGESNSAGTNVDRFDAVQGEWNDTESAAFQQAIGNNHQTTAAYQPYSYAFVTDRLVIYSPTNEAIGVEQTATVADAALTNVMTRFDMDEEDFLDAFDRRGMGDLGYAGKLFIEETGTQWGGSLISFFRLKLPNAGFVNAPIANLYNLMSHEIAHALTYGYASPEKDGFAFMHRWMSEGLAEYYSGGVAVLPSRTEASNFLATATLSPPAVSNWATMETYIGEDSPYYPYYHAAILYLLTPTEQGGAGNAIDDLKEFLRTSVAEGEGFEEHFARYFTRNGETLTMDAFRAGYDSWVLDVLK